METAFHRTAGGALHSAKCLNQEPTPHSRADQTWPKGPQISPDGVLEERVIWRQRYQAQQFDFRGRIVFARFDGCEFVKCTLLVDRGTGQLAFTQCVFKDCNIDKLEADQERGLYTRDNFFDRPLAERRAEFEHRLAQFLAARLARANDRYGSRINS